MSPNFTPLSDDQIRARARQANQLVRARALYHRDTKSTAYSVFRGHSAAIDAVEAYNTDGHPSERQVLVRRDRNSKWVNPLLVVVEREA